MKTSIPISLAILLATATASASKREPKDQFEKMGWSKIQDLSTPMPLAKETGSQNPHSLLIISGPRIEEANHLVAGEMRYSNVAGSGFIEMWTHYDNDTRYFSRTLGDYGPMAKMSGNSEWRTFMLPFRGTSGRIPTKLEINALLPGGGSMEFRDLALYEAARPHGNAWWDHRTSGIIGAILGTTMGLFGCMIGILRKAGKARRLVCGTMVAGVVAGVAFTIAGTIALAIGQPYPVWFTLLLIGIVGGLVSGFNLPHVRRSYTEHELRQISAVG